MPFFSTNKSRTRKILDAIIILVFITGSHLMIFNLQSLKSSVDDASPSTLQITDISELEKLTEHITLRQWNADNYALYMLQPKHYKKTYKELVVSSISPALPARVSLSNEIKFEMELYNNKYVVLTKNNSYDTCYDAINTDICVVVPIYHHRAIIAELYVFFNDEKTSQVFTKTVNNRIIEAQVLNKLIY